MVHALRNIYEPYVLTSISVHKIHYILGATHKYELVWYLLDERNLAIASVEQQRQQSNNNEGHNNNIIIIELLLIMPRTTRAEKKQKIEVSSPCSFDGYRL